MLRAPGAESFVSTSKEGNCRGQDLTLPSLLGLPEVVVDGDTVRIGEEGNIVSLKKAEWNVLVDLIESGKVGKL